MQKKSNSFKIWIKLLTNKSFSMEVQATDTISAIKQRIFMREGITPIRQCLLAMGRILQQDNCQLKDFDIEEGATVQMCGGVRGPDAIPGGGLFAATAGDFGGVLASPGQPRLQQQKKASALLLADSEVIRSAAAAEVKDAGSQKDVNSGSNSKSDSSMPGTDVGKLRAATILHYANVTTILRPQTHYANVTTVLRSQTYAAADPASTSPRWPRKSQVYCVYTRKVGEKELTGIVTFGLSNPCQENTFSSPMGAGIEILLECPTPQARITGANGITGTTISDSWMFAVVHEIAHQCFALGLQIRQSLEKLPLLSVEIAGVALPAEYVDPETGRCCVLLGHLGDPDVPRGFNVTVPLQHQSILQSVLLVPARVLNLAQCQAIRKDGAEARKKIAEEFVKNKSYSVCDIPQNLWSTASQPSTKTGESKSSPPPVAAASEKKANSSAVSLATSAPVHASSSAASSATSAPVHASSSAASSATSAPAHASSSAASLAPVVTQAHLLQTRKYTF